MAGQSQLLIFAVSLECRHEAICDEEISRLGAEDYNFKTYTKDLIGAFTHGKGVYLCVVSGIGVTRNLDNKKLALLADRILERFKEEGMKESLVIGRHEKDEHRIHILKGSPNSSEMKEADVTTSFFPLSLPARLSLFFGKKVDRAQVRLAAPIPGK